MPCPNSSSSATVSRSGTPRTSSPGGTTSTSPPRARTRPGAAARCWPPTRTRPAGGPHLGADPGGPDGRPGPRRRRTALAAGPSALAAQRAPLRGAPGTRQEGDHRPARRGTGEGVATQLRHPAAAGRAGRHPRPGGRPPLPRRARRRPAADRVPGRRGRPDRPLLGRRHRARPAGRGAARRGGPGRGPRQQPARPAQAHRGHQRRRHRRPRDPDGHPLPLPLGDDLSVVSHGFLGDAAAAEAAAEAVRRQAG